METFGVVLTIATNGSQISEGKALKNENLILKINIIMKTKMSNYRNCFALAYVLLVAVIFGGCEPINNEQQKKVEAIELNDYSVSNEGVQILTIDSCEYVWCKNGYGAGLTHKGNCKFCAERSKK